RANPCPNLLEIPHVMRRLFYVHGLKRSGNHAIIGWIMDRLNPLIVRIMGANINRRTLENVEKAGLRIESVEHLGLMKMVKMITAKTDKA
ncbi:MAG: hypothetical protein MUO52_00430, partial [Desulfobacterales bacterium]|nr:hypothetical protein [Desulfobacterales bacterium]